MFARLDLPEAHARALQKLIQLVPPQEFLWVLTGSAGLRLQGVDVDVHDLDIQTDEQTVYTIEKRLAGFMKTPVHLWESSNMKSLDGKGEIEGVPIELLANISHRLPDGCRSSSVDFSRLVWVEWRGLQVAVFPLQDEVFAYEAMGRAQKAAIIRETIRRLENISEFRSTGDR